MVGRQTDPRATIGQHSSARYLLVACIMTAALLACGGGNSSDPASPEALTTTASGTATPTRLSVAATPTTRPSPSPTSTPVPTATRSATSTPMATPTPEPAVLVGAGDIATCPGTADEETAKLLDEIEGTVFTLGDNAYPLGSWEDFANCYHPSWGRHRDRTRPSAGNHEYLTEDADPYFVYFGVAAGDPNRGYYSYELGPWLIIVLNSNCSVVSCEADDAQAEWLQERLEESEHDCTLAYWHHARFSSGEHGNDWNMQVFWEILYDAGADVVVQGHDHHYERFMPLDDDGEPDPENGIRSFVAGTGGGRLRPLERTEPGSEVSQATTHGVLKFELYDDEYTWEFIPIEGETFTDSGDGECH